MKKAIKRAIYTLSIVLAMAMTIILPSNTPFGYIVSASEYVSRGIDVSVHNGDINWNNVANSGIDFAIIRAGSTNVNGEILYTDRKFDENYLGAKASGINVGAYYYCGAYTKDGFERNAHDLVDILRDKTFDLPVYIDIEQASKQKALGKDTLTTYILSALDIISNSGYKAGVYANRDWYRNYIDISRIRDAGYDIWWAQYPSGEYAVDPADYDMSSNCSIWQYSSRGRISGINNNVDVNVSYTDYSNTSLVAPKINVSVNGDIATISWNKVKNATHYDLRLYFADGTSVYDNWGGNPDETELSFRLWENSDYKVQVCSADNDGNFVYCDFVYFSTSADESLVAPNLNVSVDGDIATISWNKVKNATHYDLRLYFADGTSVYDNWGGNPDETGLSFKLWENTDYKVQVCSADDNGNYVYCDFVYFSTGSSNDSESQSNKSFEEYSSVSVNEGIYYFEPLCAPGSCIDSEGGETLYDGYNHNIHLWSYLGNSNQQFKIISAGEKDGKKLYYIQNTLTKQYVSARGKNVTELPYKISIAKWYFLDCGNGYYKLINYFNDLALDIHGACSENGTNAWCYDPSDMNNSAQLFKLNSIN